MVAGGAGGAGAGGQRDVYEVMMRYRRVPGGAEQSRGREQKSAAQGLARLARVKYRS